MAPDNVNERGRNQEEDFFRREDQKLLERMRALQATETARQALATTSGISDSTVLDKLMSLNIRHEDVAALSVVPLVEVAWADGTLDAKEREAVLSYARESGFSAGTAEHALLEAWLERRPEPHLLIAWTQLIKGMSQKLDPTGLATLKAALLDRARGVARASGGLLGLGSKVSTAEAALLSKLERAFDRAT